MRSFCICAIVFSFTFFDSASAQTLALMDSTFGVKGKTEISLGNFGDELTDLYVSFNSYIIACGKVGTAVPGIRKFGMVRLDSAGTIDPTFGTNGKVVTSWNTSDYPNSLAVLSDSSMIMAGASARSAFIQDQLPAVYRFKKDGTPDPSFGGDGHVALGYDTASNGTFKNIYTESTNFLACGSITQNNSKGHSGFCAMRFKADGSLDSTFGVNGKALIPANVTSVSGFLTTNATITFIGVTVKTDSEPPVHLPIVLARMKANGFPDSTFGNNGLITTAVTVPDYNLKSTVQQDYKIVASIPNAFGVPSLPFNLVRFTTSGLPDSTYGSNGFVHLLLPGNAAEIHGLEVAKNGKTVVSGSGSSGFEKCASARINLDGTPDLTFNLTGYDVFDIDPGEDTNYLVRFPAIGQKRYIGGGVAVLNGLPSFLIGRFHDVAQNDVKYTYSDAEPFKIYPNPVASVLNIESNVGMKDFRIVDALGRQIQRFSNLNVDAYLFDTRTLPNGVYYCVAQNEGKRVMQKFIVLH